MLHPQSMNSLTYVQSAGGTSQSVAIQSAADGADVALVTNEGTQRVLVLAGVGAAATAVMPTAGTPRAGKIVLAGQTVAYTLPLGATHISTITDGGTVPVNFSIDNGV